MYQKVLQLGIPKNSLEHRKDFGEHTIAWKGDKLQEFELRRSLRHKETTALFNLTQEMTIISSKIKKGLF